MVLQQCLISEEWVSYIDKKSSGFIFSYALSSYREFSFICSDTITGQISVQWVLFGLKEKLLHFLPSKLAFITLERENVWIKAYQWKSPSPTTSPLQLNPLQVTHCLPSWHLTAITRYSSCVPDCHHTIESACAFNSALLFCIIYLDSILCGIKDWNREAFFLDSTLINKK